MNYKLLFTGIILLLLASCEQQICPCTFDEAVIHRNDSLLNNAVENYSDRQIDYWKRFEEGLLFQQKRESYRLSITVLLADYQKIYRIDREGEDAKLYVKEYAVSTTMAFREDSLVRDTTRMLTDLEWQNFKETIDTNCFWTVACNTGKRVLDGSDWNLEGFHPKKNACTNKNYHYAYRATLDSSSFQNIAYHIMDLDSFVIKELRRGYAK